MRRVRILRKDGVKQHIYIKHFKKWRKNWEWKSHLKVWVRVSVSAVSAAFYRNMQVRTYYAKEGDYGTPDNEIADFRVMKISREKQEPKTLKKEFDKILDRMEWIFESVFFALKKDALRVVLVEGIEENEELDSDEARAEGGVGIFRRASFYGGKYIYEEDDIKIIERERMKGYKEYKDERRENENNDRQGQQRLF